MTVTIDIFKPPENEAEAGRILADHMPEGRAWGRKNSPGDPMNGLINGLSSVFLAVLENIFEVAGDFDINESVNLLSDWEESVGLPDECIFDPASIEERRENVLGRLSKDPVVTLQEFTDLIFQMTGVAATLTQGATRFTINVDIGLNVFPYTFPITFGDDSRIALIQCILDRVKPANVLINYL